MGDISYHTLRILVADDFGSFRSTVSSMLVELGAQNVDTASNCEEILEQCSLTPYDIVLCDYNLGDGRHGQHVLEELRYRQWLGRRSIFVMVSAESHRNIVMSAYDAAPDDYLMKPITGKMLQTRLDRLLRSRIAFSSVYDALEREDPHTAMDILIDMSIAEDRNATPAQKMLGEMFLSYGEFRKAEKLYMSVLEMRELDWARLGLAKAKQKQGELEKAGNWLEKILDENYLFLPAYDVLCDNWLARGEHQAAQSVVQRSVDVSPMSILRQKNLAKLADKNGDITTAVDALRKVVKLGKLSCYGKPDDNLDFMRSVANALDNDCDVSMVVVQDALAIMDDLTLSNNAQSHTEAAQLLYIQSRLVCLKGMKDKAERVLVRAETSLAVEDSDIDTEVDHIRALLTLGYDEKVSLLLDRLQELYENDQSALEKLDEFLDEPASDVNKAIVADVNREGIELYNDGHFDQALSCFDKATALFPKHIGLQLNIVQALIAKLRLTESDDIKEACRDALQSISSTIEPDNPQYKRFLQLNAMARSFSELEED